MFDLALQVRLKQAKNALNDGRLDEAFAIAIEKEIRELRGGQVLLEEIVKPLLDRAAAHLAEGRPKDALADAERAIAAGGSRPEALKLREEAQEKLDAQEKVRRHDRELVESARRHLREGSLRAGQDLLGALSPEISEAGRLKREAENLQRRAARALARARYELARGDVSEAIRSTEEAMKACRHHEELPELLSDLKKTTLEKAEKSFQEGNLALASELLSQIKSVAPESLEVRRLSEVLALAVDAQKAFQRSDPSGLKVALGRLEKLAGKVAWVSECLEATLKLEDSLTAIRTSPLGRITQDGPAARGLVAGVAAPRGAAANGGPRGKDTLSKDLTLPLPAAPAGPELRQRFEELEAAAGVSTPPGSRLLLWVDGIGTYLILTSDRVSIGRAGASSRPDIALAADIAGQEAEIVRIDDDYFIVASEQDVHVNGRPHQRKLLSDGDSVDLGPRCRLVFHLPTPLSSTAVLTLHRGQRIHGDVRTVILLKEHLLLGPKGKSHVETQGKTEKVVISVEPRGLICRTQEDMLLGGESAGREALIPLGNPVQVGEVTFTITDTMGGRG